VKSTSARALARLRTTLAPDAREETWS
jgi:hypothetical protein